MKKISKKAIILMISVLLVLSVAVGSTLAYLIHETDIIKNVFDPSDVNTEIIETISGSTKSNVKVKNTGDIDAYIRAMVAITWQDASGNTYGQMPVAGTDYTISYNLNEGWQKGADGFYYWKQPVASTATTGVLIASCSPVSGKAPDGYELTVEILASGIQTLPTSVVCDQWSSGVSSVNGTALVIK